jgi:hypothetical protein
MKKLITILIIVLLVSLILVSTAIASPGKPVGSCRRGYKLELLDQHLGESVNLFLNPVFDRNGDGYICAQYYANGVHHHLDNFNRLSRCKQ